MKKYFSQLRPLERRLAVGGFVVLIVVLNWW
jgi:type II secretory pathway component PulM